MVKTRCIRWDDDVLFILDKLDCWIFIVLAHWNNNARVDMSLLANVLYYSDSEPTSLSCSKLNFCPYVYRTTIQDYVSKAFTFNVNKKNVDI
jgi:hypothetical protein